MKLAPLIQKEKVKIENIINFRHLEQTLDG
jgi:hypothetical protein